MFGLIPALVFSVPVVAHEFWLEPLNFEIEQGANIQVQIKVGQGLEGDTYAFFPANFVRFDLTTNTTTGVLKNRFAQKPAVDQPSEANGLHVLTYQSKASKLRYKKRETFEKFLKAEGIEWVLEEHAKRGLPSLDFTELYQRFAKTLIGVGDAKGEDRLTGLKFEWVVLTNPYTALEKQVIKAQLFFEGKSFPNSTVNVFIRIDDEIKQLKLKTDSEGKVDISAKERGTYLINAVHMVQPSKGEDIPDDAAWMSLWASTTFAID